MKHKRAASLIKTLCCAALILGVGYVGIVEGGKLLLSSEEKPQKAEIENTSSNIFYGKIEDDIQLFPWNYYGQNEIEGTLEYIFSYEGRDLDILERILRRMEGDCCGVEESVIDEVYDRKQTRIMDQVRISDTEYGYFFFYQDILEVEGVSYQVKVAFNEWSIQSFSCMQYRGEDVEKTQEWEAGKEVLTQMLDEYQEQIGGQLYDMQYPYFQVYGDEEAGKVYVEAYIKNMEKVNRMLKAEASGEKYTDSGENNMAAIGMKDKEYRVYDSEEIDYSYQIIELNDMILLLIQGEYNVGLYYDPISQKFCGYNYFM